MNAYELADEAMEHYNAEKQKGFNVNWMQEVANKLRKQADELTESGGIIGVLREKVSLQADYIAQLEKGLESSIAMNKALSKEKSK